MRNIFISGIKSTLHSLGISEYGQISLEVPSNQKFGDFSTNTAMVLAKSQKKSPRIIAEMLIKHFPFNKQGITEKIEIASNGFINFFLSRNFIVKELGFILEQGESYGLSKLCSGKKAIVEFVSANPTGPLTVGRGRGAVLGDTLANLLSSQGYQVLREYYFNNAGNQMFLLGDSVRLRYMELLGTPVNFPENYYQGDYIKVIAKDIFNEFNDSKKDESPLPFFKTFAEKKIFDKIKKTLSRLNIHHDTFFNETKLYRKKKTTGKSTNDEIIDQLSQKGYIQKKEGATWFLTTKLGQEKDKVLVKSTGEPTYRLPDIAYHITKFERGFDLIVNVFGADHIDEYPDVLSALEILGFDTQKVQVAINQFVTMSLQGKTMKMSTRKGNVELLDNLIDDVGADATRYFFMMRSKESHLNFNLTLAKKQSNQNPVFYLQYAHARLCSIISLAQKEYSIDLQRFDISSLNKLSFPEEMNLAKQLLRYPDILAFSAESLEPQKLVTYLSSTAELFHKFYEACRVIGEQYETMLMRVAICLATRHVIRNGLDMLGISAPNKM